MKKQYDLGYLSFDSLQEGVGASQVLRLVEEHAKNDLEVSLITFEKQKPPSWLLERVENSRINWEVLNFGEFGKIPAIQRLIKMKNIMPNASILHGRSDLATFCANRFGQAPVLWDIRSLWQAQRKIMNPKQIGKVTEFTLNSIESLNAKKSGAYTTLTKAVVPILEERFKNLPIHSAVIPTCVDLDLFQMAPSDKNQKVALVSGSFNNLYDFDLTKKVLTEIKRQLGMSIIWIRGTDSSSRNFGLGEKIINNLPHHEMPTWVSLSSVGIALCKTGDISLRGAMPTKVAEFLSCGRPVILSKGIGDFDEILKENKVGITISKNDSLQMKVKELTWLLNDPNTANRCRNVAEELFSITSAAKTYSELYQKII